MNVLIVGCGKVGTALAEQLSAEDHNITVIDNDQAVVEDLSARLDIMGVVGNGASYTILSEARVEEADVLIAVTEMDELNLLCCLIAKRASNCSTIARVRNPVYNQEIGFIKSGLGLSMIINPELAASVEISRLLRVPSAINIDTFAKGRVEILSFQATAGCPLDGLKLMDIPKKLNSDVLICAVERGDEVFIPSGDFTLRANDEISIVASPKNGLEFFEKINIETDQVQDTMIIGGGGIGYYLARQLLHMGISVKLIEKDLKRCGELSELLPKATVIHGDGIDKEMLMEEGLPAAESFVALTGLDEENILLSLYAKSVSKVKTKTVTKINRIPFDEVIESLNLGSVIIPKNIMTETILQYVRARQNTVGSNVETLYRIVKGKVEALEFNVRADCELIGVPLSQMRLKKNLLIGCINRNGRIIIPRGADSFLQGDTVIVVTTNKGLDELTDIMQ